MIGHQYILDLDNNRLKQPNNKISLKTIYSTSAWSVYLLLVCKHTLYHQILKERKKMFFATCQRFCRYSFFFSFEFLSFLIYFLVYLFFSSRNVNSKIPNLYCGECSQFSIVLYKHKSNFINSPINKTKRETRDENIATNICWKPHAYIYVWAYTHRYTHTHIHTHTYMYVYIHRERERGKIE